MVAVLSDGKDDSVVGVMVEGHRDIREYAKRIMKSPAEVFQGRYKKIGNMVRIGKAGLPCTYWSKAGPLNLVKVVDLSDVPPDIVTLCRKHGKLIATMDPVADGFVDDDIVTAMPMANAMVISAIKDEYAGEFTFAIRELFESMED